MRPAVFLTILAATLLAAGTLEHASGPLNAIHAPALGAPAQAAHNTADRCPGARKAIHYYRGTANQWRTMRDAPRFRYAGAARSPSCAYVRWAAGLWVNRSWNARTRYEHWYARVYEKWRCVHEREGAWDDQGWPHYGGLQFDDDFQRTYGPEFYRRWGDAGNWPVWAQLLAAERAFNGYGGHGARYWEPWPHTARACGLR